MNPLTIFSMLPLRAWAEVGVIAAFALFVGWAVHHEREVGRDEIRVQWNAERAGERTAADKAVAAATDETERRIAAQQEISHAAQLQVDQARADAAAAGSAAARLQQRLAIASGRCPAASDPAAAGPGHAASAAGDLRDEVLARALDAAGQLGEYADRAHIAGLACERAYQALTKGTP